MSLWKIYLTDWDNGCAYLVHECKRNVGRKPAMIDYGNKSANVIKCIACDNSNVPKKLLETMDVTNKIVRQ